MISPQKIRWNGYMSTELPFDITTCLSFDGDSGEIETRLSREAIVSETYNGAIKRGNSYKWSESMSPSITIMKEDFTSFTRDENRKILSWLTGKQTAGFLDIYLDVDSDEIEYAVLGNFVSVSQYKAGNSQVIGYVARFESLMPWALSRLETRTISGIDLEQNTMQIMINTDEPSMAVYPRITIQHGNSVIVAVDHQMITDNKWVDDDWMDGTVYYYSEASEYYYNKHNSDGSIVPTAQSTRPSIDTTSVIIKNTYVGDDGLTHVIDMRIANNKADEIIIVDGANRVISSSALNRIFDQDFIDWDWLPMYNGTNEITVIGNCVVTFEWREVRKVGEY